MTICTVLFKLQPKISGKKSLKCIKTCFFFNVNTAPHYVLQIQYFCDWYHNVMDG